MNNRPPANGNLKRHSRAITDGPSRAPARAMLKAVGFDDDKLRRPIIGVANTWIEVGPCNFHLRHLAQQVKAGIDAAGGTPMEFNTVSISDGITMGTEGMRASLLRARRGGSRRSASWPGSSPGCGRSGRATRG